MIEFRESKVAEMDRRHHHHRRRRRATDDARPICNETNATFDEDTKFIANRINVLKIFHGSNISRVRESLERLPIKLTLENVGIFALSLASIMPRTFTHLLVYPIFRLVFGTLYPAYASYKAVRTKNVKEYVKWMMYWIVFALFTCAETFTDVFLSFWFPFYYEIKIILVLWLLSPATKGSSILYRRFVHPALSRREAEIDEALARATEQGYTAVLHLGSRGVNYATTVLMQTAIKGGGGLVQQLKKSYSLSDLTGEKEDENRNTPDTRDEIDMQVEPRRRENVGRRGYSPRRTQSGSNRVDMYFSEVDVDVRQPKPREPIASLSNIRSSDDVSSGYSSGEALHPGRVGSQAEPLVRTASVGARTRPKPRSTAKKTPEPTSGSSNTTIATRQFNNHELGYLQMAAERWLRLIQEAKKTAIIQDGKRKVHFLMEDGREMVEEYHIDTNVLMRRAWREKGKLGQDVGWIVEVGDPEPKAQDNLEVSGIRESSNAPFISRRVTRVSLEWRIRNLPYPKDVYSVTAEEDGTITVKTSNKKYFKKINVPDLERAGLKPEPERISFAHQFNTLIITYKKPPLLIDLEKKVLGEVMQLKTRKEGDVQCPTS